MGADEPADSPSTLKLTQRGVPFDVVCHYRIKLRSCTAAQTELHHIPWMGDPHSVSLQLPHTHENAFIVANGHLVSIPVCPLCLAIESNVSYELNTR